MTSVNLREARTVRVTRVPQANRLLTSLLFASSWFRQAVSWYRTQRKTMARCRNRHVPSSWLQALQKQRPRIAAMVVSLEPSRPIPPPYVDCRRFSGSAEAVAHNATTYNRKAFRTVSRRTYLPRVTGPRLRTLIRIRMRLRRERN